MKKRALMLLVVATLSVVLVGSGVYAYFNDTESNSGNQFAAGTLDLVVNDDSGWATAPFTISNAIPGQSGGDWIKLHNAGTITGHSLTMSITNVVDLPGITTEPELAVESPDVGDLSGVLNVNIWLDANHNDVQDSGEVAIYHGMLSGVSSANTVLGDLPVGADTYVRINWAIDAGVQNQIQGDICTFTIMFVLNQ
jgi:predicted ribosomally synthesized peptide with SipW-like signal peptide